jgi:hypothetical protein
MKWLVLFTSAVLASAGCSGNAMSPAEPKAPSSTSGVVNRETLARLSQRSVFFAHQSVGYNIVQGVEDVLQANGANAIRIVETKDAGALGPGVFAHATVGQNGDPLSKIRGFEAYMNSGLGTSADLAMLKFCYIDVDGATDVARMFEAYRKTFAGLATRYPKTRFVHVTVPLRKVQAGPKALLKTALGRPAGGYIENARRNEYNARLRAEYGGRAPVFDLADVESSRSGEGKTTFTFQGQQLLALTPDYTYDNGHLNERGRRLAGERLLAVLSHADRPAGQPRLIPAVAHD